MKVKGKFFTEKSINQLFELGIHYVKSKNGVYTLRRISMGNENKFILENEYLTLKVFILKKNKQQKSNLLKFLFVHSLFREKSPKK
jgi:DNA-binding GntR family transcriptional regulator